MGVSHFRNFLAGHGFSIANLKGEDSLIRDLMPSFLVYLAEKVKVKPSTADQYLSHVSRFLSYEGLIPDPSVVSSFDLTCVKKGFRRIHAAEAPPVRETCRLPMTLDMFVMLDDHILAPLPPPVRVWARAVFAASYGASLRPSEYLPRSEAAAGDCVTLNGSSFQCASGKVVRLSSPADDWPRNDPPVCLTFRVDFRKNNVTGRDGAPMLPVGVDEGCVPLVDWVLSYVRMFRSLLKPDAPMFLLQCPGLPPFDYALYRGLLREFAVLLGIDPARLVPHSVRYGVVTNMLVHQSSVQQQNLQGGWTGKDGPIPYMRQSVGLAQSRAPAIYDVKASRCEHVLTLYSRADDACDIADRVRMLRRNGAQPAPSA